MMQSGMEGKETDGCYEVNSNGRSGRTDRSGSPKVYSHISSGDLMQDWKQSLRVLSTSGGLFASVLTQIVSTGQHTPYV
jgi:hypothetical protein